jgi:hypothetical protein
MSFADLTTNDAFVFSSKKQRAITAAVDRENSDR